jgi:hypothetical protein
MEHCRRAAHEANLVAQSAAPKVKKAYEDLAAQWYMLAAEIERESELQNPKEAIQP